MIRKVLSVLALASATSVAASAQTAAPAASVRPITFGVKAGGAIPMSDFSDVAKTGYLVGAQVGFATPSLPVSFRVDADFSQYKYKGGYDGNANLLAFTGNVIYNLPVSSTIAPYAIGGVGLYNMKASGGGDSETKFGFNVGAGIKIPLSGFNTFVEARYNRISTDGGSVQFIPVYFGISF